MTETFGECESGLSPRARHSPSSAAESLLILPVAELGLAPKQKLLKVLLQLAIHNRFFTFLCHSTDPLCCLGWTTR